MKSLLLAIALLFAVNAQEASTTRRVCTSAEHWNDHPVLCRWLENLDTNEAETIALLEAHAASNGLLLDLRQDAPLLQSSGHMVEYKQLRRRNMQQSLPVVLAHGMGDSCFNGGMQHITKTIGEWLDVYSVCIPTGETKGEDTKNGYFLSMDSNLEIFAAYIAKDPRLQNGFHAIGASQGNNLIRGYIAKYNNPAVHTFISINGVNAGIGAVPYCRPSTTTKDEHIPADEPPLFMGMCDLLMEQASHRAYTTFAQEHSFQANYWRDPRPSMRLKYQEYRWVLLV